MQHLRTRTDQAKSQDFIEVSVIRNETKENVQQNHQVAFYFEFISQLAFYLCIKRLLNENVL